MARVIFNRQKEAELRRRIGRRIGLEIKRARIQRGLRQVDLGDECGACKARISNLESGKGLLSQKELEIVERVLGIQAATLTTRKTVTPQEFGRAVRKARLRAGITTVTLAALLGIWDSRMTRIESGKRKPRPAEKAAIERLLETKLPEPDAYCHVYPAKRTVGS